MGTENLALFISRGGTTAKNILDATMPDRVLHGLINPALLVSSSSIAKGLDRARATKALADKDIIVLKPKDFSTPMAFGEALIRECEKRHVTLFGQYGWLAKTPRNFLERFPRGINQHPCCLYPGHPDFGGDGMYGCRCHLARILFVRMTNRNFYTSAVAQRVHPDYDRGVILKERRVEILPDDDVDALQKRVLPVEYEVQIDTLRDFAKATVQEIPGEELVLPHEMATWALCREMAKLAYPKG